MIFIVLEKHDTIWIEIWSRKRDAVSKKSKATYCKNLVWKILEFKPKFYLIVIKNDGKAVTHFGKSVKNQLGRLEK